MYSHAFFLNVLYTFSKYYLIQNKTDCCWSINASNFNHKKSVFIKLLLRTKKYVTGNLLEDTTREFSMYLGFSLHLQCCLSVLDPAKRMRGAYGYIGLFGVILLSISVALKLLGML